MYKDYSEWFAQLVLKGKESDIFLILEEDFNTYAAIGQIHISKRVPLILILSSLMPSKQVNTKVLSIQYLLGLFLLS